MLSVFRREASLWVAAPNRKKMRKKMASLYNQKGQITWCILQFNCFFSPHFENWENISQESIKCYPPWNFLPLHSWNPLPKGQAQRISNTWNTLIIIVLMLFKKDPVRNISLASLLGLTPFSTMWLRSFYVSNFRWEKYINGVDAFLLDMTFELTLILVRISL